MRKIAFLLASLLLCFPATAKRKPPKRPRILGIAGATILVTNIPEAHKFYQKLIDPDHTCIYCEQVPSQFLLLPSGQRITLEKVPLRLPQTFSQTYLFSRTTWRDSRNISKLTKSILTRSGKNTAANSSGFCSRIPRGITFRSRIPIT